MDESLKLLTSFAYKKNAAPSWTGPQTSQNTCQSGENKTTFIKTEAIQQASQDRIRDSTNPHFKKSEPQL